MAKKKTFLRIPVPVAGPQVSGHFEEDLDISKSLTPPEFALEAGEEHVEFPQEKAQTISEEEKEEGEPEAALEGEKEDSEQDGGGEEGAAGQGSGLPVDGQGVGGDAPAEQMATAPGPETTGAVAMPESPGMGEGEEEMEQEAEEKPDKLKEQEELEERRKLEQEPEGAGAVVDFIEPSIEMHAPPEEGTALEAAEVEGGELMRDIEGGEGELEDGDHDLAAANLEEEADKSLLDYGGELLAGAVKGDFIEEPTVMNVVGQVAMGFVPIAGQLADIRDTVHAVMKLVKEGGGEGGENWLNLGLTLVGWIPGIGDAIKAGKRLPVIKRLLDNVAPLKNKLASGWENARKFLSAGLLKTKRTLSQGWKNFKDRLGTLKAQTRNLFNKTKSKISQKLDDTRLAIREKAHQIGQRMGSIGTGPKKAWDAIVGGFQGFKQKAKAAYGKMKGRVTDAYRQAADYAKQGRGLLKEKAGQFKEAAKERVRGLKAKVGGAMEKVKEKVGGWAGKLKALGRKAKEKFQKSGKGKDDVKGEPDLGGGKEPDKAKTREERVAQYRESWPDMSLNEAIGKYAPNSKGVETKTGKVVYEGGDSGVNVVYDKKFDYFRLEKVDVKGKRRFLDKGGNLAHNKMVDGKQMGRSKDEYEKITHFNNSDSK